MDVSNSSLSNAIRPPIERQTAEVPDTKRQARDSEIERKELERSDRSREEDNRQDHRDERHRVDISV